MEKRRESRERESKEIGFQRFLFNSLTPETLIFRAWAFGLLLFALRRVP
jgi:hypothetical protein